MKKSCSKRFVWISQVFILSGLLVVVGCGNAEYLQRKKSIEDQNKDLPYVKNGYVDLDTLVIVKMNTGMAMPFGGSWEGTFLPPVETEKFPYVWGDSAKNQQQTLREQAMQQTYQQTASQQPPYQQVTTTATNGYAAPAFQAPRNLSTRPKLAVMEIEDQAGKLGK